MLNGGYVSSWHDGNVSWMCWHKRGGGEGAKCLEHNTVTAQVGGWVPGGSTGRVRTLNVEKFAKIYQILANFPQKS